MVTTITTINPATADIVSSYDATYDSNLQKIKVTITIKGGTDTAYASEYPRDFVILVDNSISMKDLYREEYKINWIKSSISHLLESMFPYKCRVSIMSFSDKIKIISPLTFNFELTKKSLEALSCDGFSSNIGDAIGSATLLLKERGRDTIPIIIVLTDGGDDKSAIDIKQAVDSARREGILIYVFSFGNRGEINEVLLKESAEETGGSYSYAPLEMLSEKLGNIVSTTELLSAATIQVAILQSKDSIIDHASIETMVSPGITLTQKNELEFVCPKISQGEKIEIKFNAFTAKKGENVSAGNAIVKFIDRNGNVSTLKINPSLKIPSPIPEEVSYAIIAFLFGLTVLLLYRYASVKSRIIELRDDIVSYLKANKDLTVTEHMIKEIDEKFGR